uniref:uncharacterized protein LOC120341610 n=1 Tax=Styela clava TaxID=7725 RepID=UPI0019396C78|nr:uncharacterized protein LOC120341610 [Styela clava]
MDSQPDVSTDPLSPKFDVHDYSTYSTFLHAKRTKSVSERRRKDGKPRYKKRRPPSISNLRSNSTRTPLPPPPDPPPGAPLPFVSPVMREIRRTVSEPCAIKRFCNSESLSLARNNNLNMAAHTDRKRHRLEDSSKQTCSKMESEFSSDANRSTGRKLPKISDLQNVKVSNKDAAFEYGQSSEDMNKTAIALKTPKTLDHSLICENFNQKRKMETEYKRVTSPIEANEGTRDFDQISPRYSLTNGSREHAMIEDHANASGCIDRDNGSCPSIGKTARDTIDCQTLQKKSIVSDNCSACNSFNDEKVIDESENPRFVRQNTGRFDTEPLCSSNIMLAYRSEYSEFDSNLYLSSTAEADTLKPLRRSKHNTNEAMSGNNRKCVFALLLVPSVVAIICASLFGLSYFGIISPSSADNKNIHIEEIFTTKSPPNFAKDTTVDMDYAFTSSGKLTPAATTANSIENDTQSVLTSGMQPNIGTVTSHNLSKPAISTISADTTITLETLMSITTRNVSDDKINSTAEVAISSTGIVNYVSTDSQHPTKKTKEPNSREKKVNSRRKNRNRKKQRQSSVNKQSKTESRLRFTRKSKPTPPAIVLIEQNVRNHSEQGVESNPELTKSNSNGDKIQYRNSDHFLERHNMKFKSTNQVSSADILQMIEARKSLIKKQDSRDNYASSEMLQNNNTDPFEDNDYARSLEISTDDFIGNLDDDDELSCVRITNPKCEAILPYDFTPFITKYSDRQKVFLELYDILLRSVEIPIFSAHHRAKGSTGGKSSFKRTVNWMPASHLSKLADKLVCDITSVQRMACHLRYPPCDYTSRNISLDNLRRKTEGICIPWCIDAMSACVNERTLLEMKSIYESYERVNFGTMQNGLMEQDFLGILNGKQTIISPDFVVATGIKAVHDSRTLAEIICPRFYSVNENHNTIELKNSECSWILGEANAEFEPPNPTSPDSSKNFSTTDCGEGYFQCNTKACLDWNWTCDGQNDCGQWEDEIGCECSAGQFHCDNSQCVQSDERCDGYYDCSDGSDERNCSICRPGLRNCDITRQCISASWWCDGDVDCDNAEDERFCSCESRGMLQCEGHNLCIPLIYKCDGEDDCPGGSDENACARTRCNAYEISCGGNCIPVSSVCNGKQDCFRGEDEKNCRRCEPVQLDVCRDASYNVTAFPNFLDHRVQAKTAASPEYTLFSAIVKTRCHPFLRQLGCSILAPPPHLNTWRGKRLQCSMNITGMPAYTPPRLLPCRELCQSIRSSCESTLRSVSLSWPAFLSCGPMPSEISNPIDATGAKTCLDLETMQRAFCTAEEFRCTSSGQCLPLSSRCDGIKHCADGSDEVTCDCEIMGRFPCSNDGHCVPKDWRCDGHIDCSNGHDELHCDNCTRDDKVCDDYSCIDFDKWCDGVKDCPDGSDEDRCIKLVPRHRIHLYMNSAAYNHVDWSTHESSGILIAYNEGRWSPICAEEWAPLLSHLACSQMKYSEALHLITMHSQSEVGYSVHIEKKARVKLVQESFMKRIFPCQNNRLVHLSCKPAMCGKRMLLPNDNTPNAFLYKIEAKIFGGRTARAEFWPWIASLSLQGKKHVCGATMLSSQC